jgi:hypothetical protein
MAEAANGLDPTKVSEAENLAADVEMMLAWLEVWPEDVAGREKLADQAERLAAIVNAFFPVWQQWEIKQRPEALNPADVYHRRAFASDQATLGVRRSLEERRRDILRWQPPAVVPPTEEGEALGVEITRGIEGVAPTFWKPIELLTPKAIEHRVRMFDWAVALITGAVTLIAFLLTSYGQEFGSFSDYAKAFTAGFLGQAAAAIAWNLFPPFRSYRATKTTSAAQPKTA